MIQMAGGRHPLNPPQGDGSAKPSFAVSNEDFAASDPDIIVVCPCGLDIRTSLLEAGGVVGQPWWRELRAVKEGRVFLVDGNQMFNR